MVDDAKIVARLQELLAEVDPADTSERKLREKLQEEFDVDLSDKKALVRSEVEKYLLEHRVSDEDPDDQEADEHVEENEGEVLTGSPRSKRKQSKRKQPAGEETQTKKPRLAAKKAKGKGGKADDNGKEEKKAGKGRGGQGFSKPMKVSTELADFLGSGEISRPELTKFMWSYFKDNGLQNPANKQEIICDEKLRALMNVDRFRGFGFMKHLKHHIVQN